MRLIFVYNANSGPISLIMDYFHKITSPDTYACNLCKITYSNMGMKKDWKIFIQSLGIKVDFLHRDEFVNVYGKFKSAYPAAYLKEGNNLKQIISGTEMDSISTIYELQEMVTEKLKKFKSQ